MAPVTLAIALLADPLNAWARPLLLSLVYGRPMSAEIANWIILGSSYRLTNLLPFFLVGAVLLRHGFRRDRLLVIIAAVAVLAYPVRPLLERWFGVVEFPSGSLPDTLHDVGLVAATYVVVVAATTVRKEAARTALAAIWTPLARLGRMALSLYVLHVALLAFWLQPQFNGASTDLFAFAVIVVGCPVIGVVWQRYLGVGPVEWALGWVSGRPRTRRVLEIAGS